MECNTHRRIPQDLKLELQKLLTLGRDQEYLELIAGIQQALEAARDEISKRIHAAGGSLPRNVDGIN